MVIYYLLTSNTHMYILYKYIYIQMYQLFLASYEFCYLRDQVRLQFVLSFSDTGRPS